MVLRRVVRQQHDEAAAKFRRQEQRRLVSPAKPLRPRRRNYPSVPRGRTWKSLPHVIKDLNPTSRPNEIQPRGVDLHGRALVKSPLGQYLIDSARLFVAISRFKDKAILETHLFGTSPVHPRRTLDQGFNATLSNTRARGRDQVLYRATAVHDNTSYRSKIEGSSRGKMPSPLARNNWNQAAPHSTQLQRVLMVDQLWLWIIDGNTIITSFPKRYGVDQDPSGVYEAVESRLAKRGLKKSVFHIALIVLDECSKSLFSRTKGPLKQWSDLDMFSHAIITVVR